ncbi:hypothetical protein GM1_031_00300 [Gordonia malaquae NBRC 108250]|uniref:SHOCT domain-containing protein n=1 Tax=Gordonia malaquae NBRC 108250 TaxID=1223542 RepID=M3UZ97_GORML|nr:hypothetical protein GM1_031_00300 [Gordonia malaquae NBRC 108250]
MESGAWIIASRADTAMWQAGIASDLLPGESITAFAHIFRFKPVMEALAITNCRVIGFTTVLEPGKKVRIEVRGEDIRSVEFVRKRVTTKLHIHTDRGPILFGDVMDQEQDFIREHIERLRRDTAQPQNRTAEPLRVSLEKQPSEVVLPSSSIPQVKTPRTTTLLSDEIARLADMHQKGWLDDEEFRAAKRAVISRMS